MNAKVNESQVLRTIDARMCLYYYNEMSFHDRAPDGYTLTMLCEVMATPEHIDQLVRNVT